VVRSAGNGISLSFGWQRPPVLITITAARLNGIQASGDGNVDVDQLGGDRLGGSIQQLEAVVRGSGSLEGKGLMVARADVKSSGPGTAQLMLGTTLTTFDREGQHPAR
jgi:hypothetical protein